MLLNSHYSGSTVPLCCGIRWFAIMTLFAIAASQSIDGCGTACDLFPNQSQCPTPPMHIKFVKLIPYVIPCSWLHVRIKEGLLLHSSISFHSPPASSSCLLWQVSIQLNLNYIMSFFCIAYNLNLYTFIINVYN